MHPANRSNTPDRRVQAGQDPDPKLASDQIETFERSPIFPEAAAGFPSASVWGGIDFVTTDRVPTTDCSPISTPRRMVTSEAIQQ